MSIGIVQTKYGKLAGVEATDPKYAGITYFKGVRYAASAAGENRWKAPQDQEPWEGVKLADTYAARAMQPEMMGVLTIRISIPPTSIRSTSMQAACRPAARTASS